MRSAVRCAKKPTAPARSDHPGAVMSTWFVLDIESSSYMGQSPTGPVTSCCSAVVVLHATEAISGLIAVGWHDGSRPETRSLSAPRILSGSVGPPPQISTGIGTTPCVLAVLAPMDTVAEFVGEHIPASLEFVLADRDDPDVNLSHALLQHGHHRPWV